MGPDHLVKAEGPGKLYFWHFAVYDLPHWEWLTHWSLGDMAVISKAWISNSLYGIVALIIAGNLLSSMSPNLTNEKSTSVKVMARCHQETSQYLGQCSPRCISLEGHIYHPLIILCIYCLPPGSSHCCLRVRRACWTCLSSQRQGWQSSRGCHGDRLLQKIPHYGKQFSSYLLLHGTSWFG